MNKSTLQNANVDQKLNRLQKRLDYKKVWFAQKIQHYQERMKIYTENKTKQIEECRRTLSSPQSAKSKAS